MRILVECWWHSPGNGGEAGEMDIHWVPTMCQTLTVTILSSSCCAQITEVETSPEKWNTLLGLWMLFSLLPHLLPGCSFVPLERCVGPGMQQIVLVCSWLYERVRIPWTEGPGRLQSTGSGFLYPMTYLESCFSLICFIWVPWLYYSTLCTSWIILLPFIYFVNWEIFWSFCHLTF